MANKVIKKKKINPYLSGRNNYFNFGSFMNNLAGNPTDGKLTTGAFKGMDSGLSMFMPSIGSAVGNIGGSLIGGGLLSGAGNVLSGLSNVASMIPGPIGTFGSAALGIASGVTNALVGTKEDAEAKASNALAVLNNLSTVKSASAATSFDSEGLQRLASSFKKVYTGGVFSGGKADKMNNRELDKFTESKLLADRAIANATSNIAKNLINDSQRSFFALGGPLGSLDYLLASNYTNAIDSSYPLYATNYDRLLLPKVTKELPTFSFGGELNTNGADFTNGLIFIDNGGTHESNPYEGVPMGMDQEGTPNLVEEGEVVFNDYVFSNRLRVPKAVRRKYKLREGGSLTFADAAKKLSKESEERPNDPISLNGLLAWVNDLMMNLEILRLKKESNQYANGGKVNKFGDGTPSLDDSNQEFMPYRLMKRDGTFEKLTELQYLDYVAKTDKYSDLGSRDLEDGRKLFTIRERANLDLPPIDNALMAAPIAGNVAGLMLTALNKPTYKNAKAILNATNRAISSVSPVGFKPIGDLLVYDPDDINYLLNPINALSRATARDIINTSGGNRATAMAGLLAANNNYLNAIGDARLKVKQGNREQRQRVADFNRATNMFNSEGLFKAASANQGADVSMADLDVRGTIAAQESELRDRLAWENALSLGLTGLFGNIGELGRQQIINALANYYNRHGIAPEKRIGAYGGKIKRKKKGLTY